MKWGRRACTTRCVMMVVTAGLVGVLTVVLRSNVAAQRVSGVWLHDGQATRASAIPDDGNGNDTNMEYGNGTVGATGTETGIRKERETSSDELQMHDTCMLYDKAPRTGSTTITKALGKCWRGQGRAIPYARNMPYGRVVSSMLMQEARHVAIADVHFSILDADVLNIERMCRAVVYVTSTRAMRERLLSEAKYVATEGNIRINTSIATDAHLAALRDALRHLGPAAGSGGRGGESERMFEVYPFRQSRQLSPDYIVRADQLASDLRPLLRAFRCAEDFRSTNVHDARHADLRDVHVDVHMGDVRHAHLSAMAVDTNRRGLAKIERLRAATAPPRSEVEGVAAAD